MKIVTAIDSFKGSLTSLQAGEAVRQAAQKLYKDAEVIVRPLADGGEGTVDALCQGLGGKKVSVWVTGPAKRPVLAEYGLLPDGTAVLEMAAAAGITQVSGEEKNPLYTTSFGVGQMILDAAEKGARRFIVGIGGSATNDGGAGMLMALGFDFLDEQGKTIGLGAEGLKDLFAISDKNVPAVLKDCTFRIACDVENPLCGEKGCSAVYGPQKGATAETIPLMDGWLRNYARIAKTLSPKADETYPGAGAAGGLGFAFLAFLNGKLESGVSIILEETRLEEYIKGADLVVTGEGRLDSQTAMGKAPIGVARLAKKHGKKVIAFSGCVTEDAEVLNEHGIDAYFPILRGVTTLEDALDTENAKKNLTATAYQVLRLL